MLRDSFSLLIISNNLSRPSFRQRIEIYLEKMLNRGVVASVVKLPKSEIERFRLFKKASKFDAVLLQKKCLNLFDALCLRKFSRKIIYDFDDAIMFSSQAPANDKTSHYRLFKRTAKMADHIIAGNSFLAQQAQKFNSHVEILPTGLDTKSYDIRTERRDDKIRLVWIGSNSTIKYLDSIKPSLEEIGKNYSNVVLRIICDAFFDLDNMPVEKRHWTLHGQTINLATSDIGLAPLPDNRFTRGKCGFKILQYHASGLPTIASPVGINSEIIKDGQNGYLAEGRIQWIERMAELIEDKSLRKQMGKTAKVDASDYDVGIIGNGLCDILISSLHVK
jgi:glycosyltransferase involved in cell wall biosynthesis